MKIGLCGTMSVGKTTLVNALKDLQLFKNYNFATEQFIGDVAATAGVRWNF